MATNTSSTTVTPAEMRGWNASTLLRFLAVVIVLCVLACLYFWQLNNITTIRRQTTDFQKQTRDLEHANAALMLQVAAWNRPDYIQTRANALGLVPASQTAYVQLQAAPPTARTAVAPAVTQPALAKWWTQLAGELQKRWARITGSPSDVAQASR
jgi:cell division protein FtsL